jgi:hypothetical protein
MHVLHKNEVTRIVQRRDEYDRERERGYYRPSGEDIEGPGGRNPSIPRLPSSGNRPGCPPRRDPGEFTETKPFL